MTTSVLTVRGNFALGGRGEEGMGTGVRVELCGVQIVDDIFDGFDGTVPGEGRG
jgi:hypothetical protein